MCACVVDKEGGTVKNPFDIMYITLSSQSNCVNTKGIIESYLIKRRKTQVRGRAVRGRARQRCRAGMGREVRQGP